MMACVSFFTKGVLLGLGTSGVFFFLFLPWIWLGMIPSMHLRGFDNGTGVPIWDFSMGSNWI